MILKETILSAFSDRLTLLRWLKKVEAALNNAVLVDISLQQISETEMKLKFVFENGDFVESPVLTIPKGKDGTAATVKIGRVISAEPNVPPDVINTGTDTNAVLDFIIPKGKDGLDGQGIAATVEVGTVTTGAAGTNASVTNVGTEQRAVLNFVIPRGDQGEAGASGEAGAAGVGFDDATQIDVNSGTNTLTSDNSGLNIAATFKVTAGDEVYEIPSSMRLAIKGSDTIVIDVDESGTFFDIHLDADILAKLNRVLVTPMAAPQSISLVAVDTANAQTMLTLGSGLSVDNGVLSASGGGGATNKLYLHHITFDNGKKLACLSRSNETSLDDIVCGKIMTEGALFGMALEISTGSYQSVVFSIQGYGLTRLTTGFVISLCVYDLSTSSLKTEEVATNANSVTAHTCEEIF